MKTHRLFPLYMRIFLSVSVVVILAQSFLTVYLSIHLQTQYLQDTIEKSKSMADSASRQIQSAYNQLIASAYSLIYSDINQDLMFISEHASETKRMELESALKSLLTVMNSQKSTGVDFVLMSSGRFSGVYSTVINTGLKLFSTATLDYTDEEWFQDFQSNSSQTSCFYPNVSYRPYSFLTSSPMHVRIFRINPLHDTSKTIGYLTVIITGDFFQELLSGLSNMASDILLLDANGECLYESLSTMDSDTLCSQAQRNPQNVYSLNETGSHYIPMEVFVGDEGWTLYCAADVSQTYASLQHTYSMWILISLALLLCLLLLIYHLCRRLTLPLKRVVDGMSKVKEGEYNIHLAEQGNDEVSALTTAFNSMAHQLDEAHRNLRKYQMLQQSTAFYALQQQVNPHMLFNTLDMIIGMATQQDYAPIISTCSCLASMFRYSLSRDLTVPLGEELNHIRNYIDILTLRNGGRIRGMIDCPKEEADTLIPKLSLQPFVENSVKYAFEQKTDDCLITVQVERFQDFLTVTIYDNGSGFAPNILQELKRAVRAPFSDDVSGRHIGILNVCKRMNLIYGEHFSIELDNAAGGGAVIRLKFLPDFPKTVI